MKYQRFLESFACIIKIKANDSLLNPSYIPTNTLQMLQDFDNLNYEKPFAQLLRLRERSLLTLGTRVEDNFAQLEKFSYPTLNISAKWFSTPIQNYYYY